MGEIVMYGLMAAFFIPMIILEVMRTRYVVKIAKVRRKIREGTATPEDLEEAAIADHLYKHSLRDE